MTVNILRLDPNYNSVSVHHWWTKRAYLLGSSTLKNMTPPLICIYENFFSSAAAPFAFWIRWFQFLTALETFHICLRKSLNFPTYIGFPYLRICLPLSLKKLKSIHNRRIWTGIQCVLLIPGQRRFYGVIMGYFDPIKRPLKLMPRPWASGSRQILIRLSNDPL